MPKHNVNYQNTVIYKWVCNDLNVTEIYVGSTTDIIRRRATHKGNCNNSTLLAYDYKIYKTMRDNGGFSNWTMLEIEKYPCEDKAACKNRERHWMELLHAGMNTQIPGRSSKEYYTEWTQDNPNYQKDYQKYYYTNNKDKFSVKNICSCGGKYTHGNESHHNKSTKHLSYLQNLNISEITILENSLEILTI